MHHWNKHRAYLTAPSPCPKRPIPAVTLDTVLFAATGGGLTAATRTRITVCLPMGNAKNDTPSPPPDLIGAGGVGNMTNSEVKFCLSMARSLDAAAARTRDDSYLRKLLEEQAAKYRADAASK
jgi:hypothetical protein